MVTATDDRPGAFNTEWAATKAGEAMRYLAVNYPEEAGSEVLHAHQEASRERMRTAF